MNSQKREYLKIIIIFGIFWMFGILLALFLGLGWFFLIETIRRILGYVPSPQNSLRRILNIEMLPDNKEKPIDLQRTSKFLSLIIIICWTAITILVFIKMNIPLIDLFHNG